MLSAQWSIENAYWLGKFIANKYKGFVSIHHNFFHYYLTAPGSLRDQLLVFNFDMMLSEGGVNTYHVLLLMLLPSLCCYHLCHSLREYCMDEKGLIQIILEKKGLNAVFVLPFIF